jgi:hypothetical protein
MIRHIVLWRLKSRDEQAFAEVRGALQAQVGRIPGLVRLEVGRSFNTGRRAADSPRITVTRRTWKRGRWSTR